VVADWRSLDGCNYELLPNAANSGGAVGQDNTVALRGAADRGSNT
jgi:hypothetical protein